MSAREQVDVLIVEDNPITRRLLRVTLESGGYGVREAADGRAALDLAAAAPPDLVVQDLLLPDMEGVAVAQRMRLLPGIATVPIIAISGMESKLDQAAGAGVAFADRLYKPVEPSRLLAAVAEQLPRPVADEPPPVTAAVPDEHGTPDTAAQLALQLARNAELERRCALQEARLTVLGEAVEAFLQALPEVVRMRGTSG